MVLSSSGRSWRVWGKRDLDVFAEFCDVLAQLARSANAVHVQQFIGDASNSYLPGRSSTVPPAPQGEVVDGETLELTPVERRVVRPDRTEQEMLRLISAQRSVMRSFRVIVMGWRACAKGDLPDVCPDIVDAAGGGPSKTWGGANCQRSPNSVTCQPVWLERRTLSRSSGSFATRSVAGRWWGWSARNGASRGCCNCSQRSVT